MLSQLFADFIFQTDSMVANKKWFSKHMFLHIGVVFLTTLLLSFSWKIAVVLALAHWLIDGIKCSLQKSFPTKESSLFFADQLIHLLSIVIVWALWENIWDQILNAMALLFVNFRISLLVFGYVLVMWPIGYAMKFVLKGIEKTTAHSDEEKLEHGGKLIGMFERMIIITFVYLNQYEAIGFLITGKSIIRFAQKEEGLRSEYVLVGTMMSYAFSIIVGVVINWLLG
ncbi:MAG: DUF3307 domain-containing protein [Bacteroidia bacterium]|nr:DUF3307 domain-containing protein [Bacteroidia bacterium]MCF8446476.1 DUF3307 domain-containing protein [Bacteroidia bacterium]